MDIVDFEDNVFYEEIYMVFNLLLMCLNKEDFRRSIERVFPT